MGEEKANSDLDVFLTIRISTEQREAIALMAKQQDRSVSAEIRRALRAWVEAWNAR